MRAERVGIGEKQQRANRAAAHGRRRKAKTRRHRLCTNRCSVLGVLVQAEVLHKKSFIVAVLTLPCRCCRGRRRRRLPQQRPLGPLFSEAVELAGEHCHKPFGCHIKQVPCHIKLLSNGSEPPGRSLASAPRPLFQRSSVDVEVQFSRSASNPLGPGEKSGDRLRRGVAAWRGLERDQAFDTADGVGPASSSLVPRLY